MKHLPLYEVRTRSYIVSCDEVKLSTERNIFGPPSGVGDFHENSQNPKGPFIPGRKTHLCLVYLQRQHANAQTPMKRLPKGAQAKPSTPTAYSTKKL